MKSVPVFIYFEFSDAEFREVCLRTCNVVPGGRSPSPICTVVQYLSRILKKETSVNVMTPSHLKMGLTKCYVRYPRSVCVALRARVTHGGYYVRLMLVIRISASEVATLYTYCDRFLGMYTT